MVVVLAMLVVVSCGDTVVVVILVISVVSLGSAGRSGNDIVEVSE